MNTKMIPRVQLPRTRYEVPPYKPGHWVMAGTPGDEPYPCTCRYDPCRYERCPDRTRSDRELIADRLPPGCCGRPDAAPVRPRGQRKTAETPGWHAGGDVGGSGAPRGSEEMLTAASVLADETDLWAAPLDALPSWDALDDPPLVAGDGLEDPEGDRDTPEEFQPLREVPEAVDGLAAMKRRVREAQCSCRTPWDADPPVFLLAADTKEGTAVVLHLRLSETPGADVRAEADQILTQQNLGRSKPWKAGRHALLPPIKGKTRECWSAPLKDARGVAVIDLPPAPVSGGVHCSDCCRNFANAGAWELHRPRSKSGCVDPASVMLVPRGTMAPGAIEQDETLAAGLAPIHVPLLKCNAGGVWSIDQFASWGPQGPVLTADTAQTIWSQAQQKLSATRWKFGCGHNRHP